MQTIEQRVGPERIAAAAIGRHPGVGALLALAAFLLYASLVLLLPQARDNSFACERSSVAAAVSHVVYGARIGSLYADILDQYLKAINTPLSEVLRDTPQRDAAHSPVGGKLLPTTQDGNGIGYPIIATAAFRLFGVRAAALPLMMLSLMALSAVLFLRRFPQLAVIVTLYFATLTALLFTTVVWNPAYAANMPVAGIRYYPLVSILPALFVLLDISAEPIAAPRAWLDAGTLAVQVAILVFAVLARGSAFALIATIAVVAAAVAFRHRQDRIRLRQLARKSLVMGLTTIGLIGAIALAVPHDYVESGRFGTVIWNRITTSLGLDPAFPYPGVKQMFAACEKYIPQGIQPGVPDDNGHCIWVAYIITHQIPINEIGSHAYDGQFETAMRDAFFAIARRWPKEVLTTFVYYKPSFIVWSVKAGLVFNLSAYPPWAIGLLAATLAVLTISVFAAPLPLGEFWWIFGVAALSAASTIPAYIAVWAMPHTAGDLLFFCLFLPGLGLCAAPQAAKALLSPASPQTSS